MEDETGRLETTSSTYRRVLTDGQIGLILAITFVGMLESALTPALPAIADALGVSDGRIGLLVTAFKVPSILVIPVAAIAADRFGRRLVLLPSLALFGTAGASMYFLESFGALLAVAFVMGIGAAVIFPITVTMLGDLCTGPANAAAQGFRVAVVGVAAIAIPALTGYLSAISWNYPFVLFVLAFPILGLAYARLRETIEPAATSGSVRDLTREYGGAMRTELQDPNVRILVAGGFVRGFVRYGVLTFVPLYAVRILGASAFEAGALLSIRGFAYLLVSPVSGLVVDRVGRKRGLIGAMLTSLFALIAIPVAPTLSVLSTAVLAYFVGDAVFDPVMKDTVTTIGHPDYLAGTVNALYAFKRTGQTVSPALFGLVLAAFGYDALFVLSGLVVLGYLVAFRWTFTVERRSTAREGTAEGV